MSGAILVPAYLNFNERGLGRSKGIPGTMIAGSTFDNIVCIILFGIVQAVSMSKAQEEITGEKNEIGMTIGMLFI
jgi:hypothetical protein